MTYAEAETAKENPFDLTKIWSHSKYPLREIGRMVLNRNPTNYFAEVEQLAFAPANMVPGIEPSPDKMLQGRLFSYNDTHRHRLGANYEQIPVNKPFNCPVSLYSRDGPMRVDSNSAGAPNYFPNSFSGPQPDPKAEQHKDRATGDVARYNTKDDDNFTQCGNFYRRTLDAGARDRLTSNIAGHLSGAQEFIQQRAIANFAACDAEYGRSIAAKIQALKKSKGGDAKVPPTAPLNPPRKVPAVGKL
jgi:catalase